MTREELLAIRPMCIEIWPDGPYAGKKVGCEDHPDGCVCGYWPCVAARFNHNLAEEVARLPHVDESEENKESL